MMEFEGKEGCFKGKLGWWSGGGDMNGELVDYRFNVVCYFFGKHACKTCTA